MTEEKSSPSYGAVALGMFLLVAVVVAIIEVPRIWKERHAATPESLASVALDQTPRALARSLSASKERPTEVEVELRHGTSFEKATFGWGESPDHVSKISLEAVEQEERAQKKAGDVQRSLAAKLDGVLPGVSDGRREWGAVAFDAPSNGNLSFSVKPFGAGHQPNRLFARQVEAARQILLEVAFDVPHTVSKEELADTLGTGYPIKELAAVDPRAPEADTVRALTSKLAAAIEESDGVRVPIDHVIVSSAKLRWTGFHATPDLSFQPRSSFADRRAAFVACLEKQTGGPALHDGSIAVVRFAPGDPLVIQGIQINVTEKTVETFTYDKGADITTYSALIAAMGACNN